MRPKIFLPVLAASLVCLTACDVAEWGGFEKYNHDFHFSYPLSAGGRLTAETFNGSVEISGWEQNTVDISGTTYGPTQQIADELKVDIGHTADSVDIRIVRPYERRNNMGARLVIKIPRGAVLERITSSNGSIRTLDGSGPARLKTSNGSIHVQGLQGHLNAETSNASVELEDVKGDVVAHTSNGRVRADRLKGALDATTSNSSIQAEIASADQPIRAETSNGSVELTLPDHYNRDVRVSTNNSGITLHLPPEVNAHVVARTSNSSISTDFDVSVRGEIGKNHMDAVIGNGGPLFDLSTSNGSIRLQKM